MIPPLQSKTTVIVPMVFMYRTDDVRMHADLSPLKIRHIHEGTFNDELEWSAST